MTARAGQVYASKDYREPRHANFNEKKATQVAARFLARARETLPYMKLLKLMYIADREALKRWGAPISNDRYVSMKLGPVLSNVYDRLVVPSEAPTFWDHHISSPENYCVRLVESPGDDQLSDAEDELLSEVFQKYGHMTQWQLNDLTLDFAEWADPDGSSVPIEVNEILRAVGFQEDEAEIVAREIKGFSKMRALSKH